MNDLVRQKLCEIVAKYKRAVCDDPKRLRGLLADLCPGQKREVHVLVLAQEQRIANDLLTSSAGQPWEVVAGRLVKRLVEEVAMAESAARWAVESWALALGKLPAEVRRGILDASAGAPQRPDTRAVTGRRPLPLPHAIPVATTAPTRAQATVRREKPGKRSGRKWRVMWVATGALLLCGILVAARWLVLPGGSRLTESQHIAAVERWLMRNGSKGSKGYFEENGPKDAPYWRRAAENGSPAGQYLYGRALELGTGVQKDPQLAIEWYRKAAEKDFVLAQNKLGHCYLSGIGVRKDPAEAVRWLRKAAENGFFVAQDNLGLFCETPEESRSWFDKAARQGYAPASLHLADYFVRSKEYETAIGCYTQALAQGEGSENKADVYHGRAWAYQNSGRRDLALIDYDMAIGLEPNNPGIYNNRGLCWSLQGKDDKAINDYTQAIQLSPAFALPYRNRAQAYDRKGWPDLAQQDRQRALELEPRK